MEREKVNIWWGPPKKFTSRIEERKISWLELFYDLVYVIAISRITHLFAAHPGLSGLLDYSFLFIIVFWGWLNGSLYHDLHGSPGIRTRFMTLWQMIALSGFIVCLDHAHGELTAITTSSLIVLEIYITYIWWSVGIYDKAHRVYSRRYTACFLSAALLMLMSIYSPESWKPGLLWTALLLNYLPAFLVLGILQNKDQDFSLSSNMVERLGLFTIIVFGESVLGVINSSALSELDFIFWIRFSLGVLIVFALWWIFFSLIADRESKKGFLNANFIQLAYIPTLSSLGIIGASFPVLTDGSALTESGETNKLFFGGALLVFLAGITLLTVFLEYPEDFHYAKRKMRQLLVGAGLIILLVTVFFPAISLTVYLLAVFVPLLFIVIVMTRIWFVVQLKLLAVSNPQPGE